MDNIRIVPHLGHQLIFLGDIAHLLPEGLGDRFVVQTGVAQEVDLVVAVGDGDHLQRGFFRIAVEFSLDLIYSAIAAGTDLSDDLPAGPL